MFKQPPAPVVAALDLFNARQLRDTIDRQECSHVLRGVFYSGGTASLQLLMGNLPLTSLATAAATFAQVKFIANGRRYSYVGPEPREIRNNVITSSNNIIMGGVSAALQATALVETATDMARLTMIHNANNRNNGAILTGTFGVMAAMGTAACLHRMYKARQGLHQVRALRKAMGSREECA